MQQIQADFAPDCQRQGRMSGVSRSVVDDFGRKGQPPAPKGTRDSRRRRRRSSTVMLVGILMLVTGLTCLVWVGYQFLGTNAVSHRAFEKERDTLRHKWSNEKASDPSDRHTPVIPGDAIGLLRIPAFGTSYEIPILSGTDLNILSRGVGHYTGTADPGQVGNFAIAGHRVTHGQPFARLLELNKGDQVVVETKDAIYTYVLDTAPRDVTVDDAETWVLEPVPGKPGAVPTEALITLTTCQDLFHSPDRSIGFGHLESTRKK
jgi:sortase A